MISRRLTVGTNMPCQSMSSILYPMRYLPLQSSNAPSPGAVIHVALLALSIVIGGCGKSPPPGQVGTLDAKGRLEIVDLEQPSTPVVSDSGAQQGEIGRLVHLQVRLARGSGDNDGYSLGNI